MTFDREAFRAAAAASFKGLRQHDVKLRQGKVTLLSPTSAMYAGTGTYSDRDTSGAASSGAVAWTIVYRMDKGAWRVITMHEAITPDAPHAEFTRFTPGADMGRHSHTNTVTIVVLKGAYLYRDKAGEKRVAAGDWLRIPAGKVHWSGSDKEEGATSVPREAVRLAVIAGFRWRLRRAYLASGERHLQIGSPRDQRAQLRAVRGKARAARRDSRGQIRRADRDS